ncbi:DUF6153 family protein [Streptomyces sulfonofaciens]|uniref:DUF6153 family protein n=1 Tax=Streptomyces sulfonofaciens TaxID=68272 RepID=UPI001E656D90|nr:DUF6153 family protein [Streptomyces sulfonofaciens]
MTGIHHPLRPVAGVRWMLVVLAVLAGVIAMHGLSPSGAPASGRHTMMTVPVGPDSAVHRGGAQQVGERCTRRHAEAMDAGGTAMVHAGDTAMVHAGGTCAAGGTSAAYTPPAPLSASAVPTGPDPAERGATGPADVAGRAPPDLSELQLLRI